MPIGLGLVLIRPDLAQRHRGCTNFDLLDRFLANMEVGVGAFTSCDIRLGYQLTFEFCSRASLHHCLAGRGTLKIRNGSTIMLRQHSFPRWLTCEQTKPFCCASAASEGLRFSSIRIFCKLLAFY